VSPNPNVKNNSSIAKSNYKSDPLSPAPKVDLTRSNILNKDISHVHYPQHQTTKFGKSGQQTLRDSSDAVDDAMKAQYASNDYDSQT
jgi:hypothetical protein